MQIAPVACALMHSIERLRMVARADWAPPEVLAAEAAWALADLAVDEPYALLPACRRLLERHPGCGPLWWAAARILCAGDAVAEAERCGDELDRDRTADVLADALDEAGRAVRHGGVAEVATAQVVVVVATALGGTGGDEGDGMVVDPDDMGLLEAARCLEVPVWVEAGVGRVLPPRLWLAASQQLTQRPVRHRGLDAAPQSHGARGAQLTDLAGVAMVAGPGGVQPPAAALQSSTCPEPPELVGRW